MHGPTLSMATLAGQDRRFEFEHRTSCPVCGGSPEIVYSAGFDEEPVKTFIARRYHKDTARIASAAYSIAQCSSCGLLYQEQVGSADFLDELYSAWIDDPSGPEAYDTYVRDISNPLESRDGHEIMAAARFLKKDLHTFRTLDYGMGWGLWACIAKFLGCDSWGFDLSAARREFAARKGIRVLREDTIPDSAFDFINTEQVFEHVVDPAGLAARLARGLAPGGILKISVPSAEALATQDIGRHLERVDVVGIMPIHPLEHVNGFRRASLERLGVQSGLVPVRPPLHTRYAFLVSPGTTSIRRPAHTVKELIRPLLQYHLPRNLYCWYQKLPHVDARRSSASDDGFFNRFQPEHSD
jgi:SAM-dependent methyltransferase